jgi:hypothetical protein
MKCGTPAKKYLDLRRAAELYLKAGATVSAANVFDVLGWFETSINTLLSKREVDEALIRLNSDAYSSALASSTELRKLRQRAVRLGVREVKRVMQQGTGSVLPPSRSADTTMDLIIRATYSYEEQVALLVESGCTRKLAEKLVEHGEHRRAVHVLMDGGEHMAAAQLLRKMEAGANRTVQERVTPYITDGEPISLTKSILSVLQVFRLHYTEKRLTAHVAVLGCVLHLARSLPVGGRPAGHHPRHSGQLTGG